MGIDNKLIRNEFPLSNKYNPDFILDNAMGLNAIWLTEWLTKDIVLKPGMKVLDLGCGCALSSIFLAREYGVQVWAYDLWIKPTDNLKRIIEYGVDDLVYPVHGDAKLLPYADGFFDVIISVDSYIYFGSDDLYLNYITGFLKKDGILAVAMPGLVKDFENGIPAHLKDFWGQDCWGWHTLKFWENHFLKTDLVDIKSAEYLADGCSIYVDWKKILEQEGRNPWSSDIEILQSDNGEYIGFIKLIAGKKQSSSI